MIKSCYRPAPYLRINNHFFNFFVFSLYLLTSNYILTHHFTLGLYEKNLEIQTIRNLLNECYNNHLKFYCSDVTEWYESLEYFQQHIEDFNYFFEHINRIKDFFDDRYDSFTFDKLEFTNTFNKLSKEIKKFKKTATITRLKFFLFILEKFRQYN